MRKYYFSLLLLFVAVAAGAQAKKDCNIGFASNNSVGFVTGESNAELLVQTVNGIEWKGWFLGAGVGLDYYNVRSVPVFGELRKKLLNKSKSPYVYASAGHHYLWLEEESMWEKDHKGGFYYDMGVGYEIGLSKSRRPFPSSLFFSAGYSGKKYSKKQDAYPWMSVWPRPFDSFKTFEYKDSRISVKMGLTI